MSNYEISVVIPIYNEEGNLPELYRRLKIILEEKLRVSYEIIFIDDGSRDNSWSIIENLYKQNNNVKGVKLSRNFGHHIAISAGIDYTAGNAVILMDGDLQDPPEEIPKLYEKFKEGYDIVYAARETRRDTVFKKLSSRFFYLIFKILANIKVSPEIGIYRIMSQPVTDALRACRERSRFIVGLISWVGFTSAYIETERNARHAGKTKYTFLKLLRLAVDSIISFSYIPLRIATYMGFLMALVGYVVGSYMIVKKILFGIPILGYASIIVSVLFISGIQLVIIGIMGEYIGRIYTEVQNRPLYLIKEKIGLIKN